MRITIVNRHRDDTLGGSEVQCDFIADGLTKRGHQVTYVAPGGRKEIYDRSYKVVPCAKNEERMAGKILRSKPDVVYWRFNKIFFRAVIKKIKQQNIPVVFAASSVNDVEPWFFKKNVGLRKKIKELSASYWNHLGMKYVDAVTVNNKDYLGRLPVSRQEFIANGMSTEYVPFDWPRPYGSWIASIKQIKRPELMVKLARDFRSEDMDFIMVGKIQEKEYNWIRKKEDLPPNLYYIGPKSLEEVSGILKASAVHVHTCLPEGFPNVFIQAWVQGTPSVSLGFDPGGYIQSRGLGFCADETWELFTEKIDQLIRNRDEREQMGENARRFAREIFSTETMVDKVEELMRSLVR